MAAGAFVILPGLDKRAVFKLQRVLQNPQRVMKQVGFVVLADAQKAFKEQRLGEFKWPQRYPRQSKPFINIAGVVGDFLAGRKNPPARRFDPRPANIDTGMTLRSLTPGRAVTVQGYVVTVGTTVPQAPKLQWGGISKQRITQKVKDSLGDWFRRERAAFKRVLKKAGGSGGFVTERKGTKKPKGGLLKRMFGSRTDSVKFKSTSVKQAAQRLAAVEKLAFLFHKNVLVTRIGKRPFLGITDEAAGKILRIIAGEFLPPGIRGKVSS